MEKYLKNKWQIRAAALTIFLLGFLAGALSLNFYRLRHPAMSEMRGRFELALERLHLNSEQRTQVEKILSDSRAQLAEMRRQSEPRVKEIRQQTDAQMKAVLNPDQWQQWQQMMNDFRSRRRDRGQ